MFVVRLLLKFVQYGSSKVVSHFMMSVNNDDFKLNDLIINAAQTIPKKQFPELMGLQTTLLLKKPQPR